MPFYDYECGECGPFTVNRPMAEFDEPSPCPACRAVSRRVFLTAPRIGGRQASDGSAPSQRTLGAAHAANCACCLPRGRRAFEATAATNEK
jgi:putative FmdB family regulatory protein